MRTRSKAAFAGLLAAAALAVTGCAGTGSSYGYGYGYNAGYDEFCSGPYRLQPEYCRIPETRGTFYLRGSYRDRDYRYGRYGRYYRDRDWNRRYPRYGRWR